MPSSRSRRRNSACPNPLRLHPPRCPSLPRKDPAIRPRSFGETVRFAIYDWPMAKREHGIEEQSCSGRVIIPADVNVWPHELRTADALARAGYVVEFIQKSEIEYEKTPDVLIDGIAWEMKAPRSDNIQKVQKTLRNAIRQSPNIIYDSHRIRRLNDFQIKRELEKWAKTFPALKKLIFIDKRRKLDFIK